MKLKKWFSVLYFINYIFIILNFEQKSFKFLINTSRDWIYLWFCHIFEIHSYLLHFFSQESNVKSYTVKCVNPTHGDMKLNGLSGEESEFSNTVR